jgi:hypothetical protein
VRRARRKARAASVCLQLAPRRLHETRTSIDDAGCAKCRGHARRPFVCWMRGGCAGVRAAADCLGRTARVLSATRGPRVARPRDGRVALAPQRPRGETTCAPSSPSPPPSATRRRPRS